MTHPIAYFNDDFSLPLTDEPTSSTYTIDVDGVSIDLHRHESGNYYEDGVKLTKAGKPRKRHRSSDTSGMIQGNDITEHAREQEPMPPSPPSILSKMLAIMDECPLVQKNSIQNDPTTGREYSAIRHDDVAAALRPLFIKYRVLAIPQIEAYDLKKIDGDFVITISGYVDFICCDTGAAIQKKFVGYAIDSDDKAAGKAESMAVKYAFLKAFSIGTGEDEEHRRRSRMAAAPRQTTPKEPGSHTRQVPPQTEQTQKPANGVNIDSRAQCINTIKKWINDDPDWSVVKPEDLPTLITATMRDCPVEGTELDLVDGVYTPAHPQHCWTVLHGWVLQQIKAGQTFTDVVMPQLAPLTAAGRKAEPEN